MLPILLLGVNFARSQLLLLGIILAYVACLAGFLAFHEQLSDLIFFVRQQAIYGIALAAMVTVPAIQNERKSRRVLSVLSKGIHRWQYLGGLLCGVILVTGVFCLAVSVAAVWLAHQASAPVTGLAELMLMLFPACAAGAATALFCSVFLHPLLALPAAAFILLFPLVTEAGGLNVPPYFFPVFSAMRAVLAFKFQRPETGLLSIAAAAMIHVAVFWGAASVVFLRRDVTVASE